jgi:SpoVK/Ycf46/Vps4 family AAA+-type ATPase
MSVVRPVTTNGPLASVGLPDGVVKEIRGVLTSVEVAKPKGALFLSGGLAKVAAGGIAHELGRGLFHVDLSRVVSKFIGETEKNLDLAFKAAEEQDAILFFDEADALFGKRTEIKDGHDRFANIEVSYLLQKMESFSGLVIVATNAPVKVDACRFCRYVALGK